MITEGHGSHALLFLLLSTNERPESFTVSNYKPYTCIIFISILRILKITKIRKVIFKRFKRPNLMSKWSLQTC